MKDLSKYRNIGIFAHVVEQIKSTLGAKPLVMVLPIGIDDQFKGVVNLLTRKAWVWEETGQPEKYRIEEIPENMREKVEQHRAEPPPTPADARGRSVEVGNAIFCC